MKKSIKRHILSLLILLLLSEGIPFQVLAGDTETEVYSAEEKDAGPAAAESFEERYGIRTDIVPYDRNDSWEAPGESPYKNDNSCIIMDFLMGPMGLHLSAAVGILTNIYCESSFRPDALGDNGTSYGICQWHLGRWDALKAYCDQNGMDWHSLNGQLHFLKHECDTGYPATMTAIRKTTNDAAGAGESARLWCRNFEVPADTENVSLKRRDLAIEQFWPVYKDYGVEYVDLPVKTLSENETACISLSKVKASAIPAQTYCGEEFTVNGLKDNRLKNKKGEAYGITLKYKGKTLTDEDVEVVSVNNALMPGTASIELRGRRAAESATGFSFEGSLFLTFKIKSRSLKGLTVEGIEKSYDYTGEEIRPVPVLSGIPELKEGDYTLEYSNNLLPGKAILTIRGIKGFSGTKKVKFKINALSITDKDFMLCEDTTETTSANSVSESEATAQRKECTQLTMTWEKDGCTPLLLLYWKDKKLVPGIDYTISYKNNKKPADATSDKAPLIIVKGKGGFKGSIKLKFSITARSFEKSIRVSLTSTESGLYKPVVTDIDGSSLKQGTDYKKPVYYLKEGDQLRRLNNEYRPKTGDIIYIAITGKGGYTADTVYVNYTR